MKLPKISVLCVTHNRPEFMPWLLWNYGRQTWENKELIIVDSSPVPSAVTGARTIHAPGMNVPQKRNLAMLEATGDCITWLDDDDWRHPDSLAILHGLLTPEFDVAGGRWSWFMDLDTCNVNRFCERMTMLFACLLVDTAVACSIPFDEQEERGSDLTWMESIAKRPFAFTYDPLSFFLCHDRNLGNKAALHQFNRPIDDAVNMIGDLAWGDTSQQIGELKRRMAYGN